MTIVENLQREDLNPMEQARAFDRLSREFKLTQEEMATRTGKDRASIGNYIRLLKLPEGTQVAVQEGALSFGHARALLALESQERVYAAMNQILGQSLSVRQTEKLIQAMINPEPKPEKAAKPAPPPQDANVHEAQEMLQRKLGLKVRIEDKHGKGRVIIEYARLEDFDAILAALGDS
jgi:ParB family chromosome partitioning protein